VLAPTERSSQSLGLDAEQQTLAVVVQDLGVLGQEGPGGASNGEDLGKDVGPGSSDGVGVNAAGHRRTACLHPRRPVSGSFLARSLHGGSLHRRSLQAGSIHEGSLHGGALPDWWLDCPHQARLGDS
jgi:hypothetical protein